MCQGLGVRLDFGRSRRGHNLRDDRMGTVLSCAEVLPNSRLPSRLVSLRNRDGLRLRCSKTRDTITFSLPADVSVLSGPDEMCRQFPSSVSHVLVGCLDVNIGAELVKVVWCLLDSLREQ